MKLNITEGDLKWLAATIDCEGSIFISKRILNNSHSAWSVTVSVGMTNKEYIDKIDNL